MPYSGHGDHSTPAITRIGSIDAWAKMARGRQSGIGSRPAVLMQPAITPIRSCHLVPEATYPTMNRD